MPIDIDTDTKIVSLEEDLEEETKNIEKLSEEEKKKFVSSAIQQTKYMDFKNPFVRKDFNVELTRYVLPRKADLIVESDLEQVVRKTMKNKPVIINVVTYRQDFDNNPYSVLSVFICSEKPFYTSEEEIRKYLNEALLLRNVLLENMGVEKVLVENEYKNNNWQNYVEPKARKTKFIN